MEFDRPKPEQEQKALELLLQFKLDPLGFVMTNFPWGEKGTPLEHFTGPRPWQKQELERIGHAVRLAVAAKENDLPYEVFRAAYSSGRGPGKSALLAMVANWVASCWLGANVMVAANTEGQLIKKIMPEIARWFTMGLNRHFFSNESLAIRPAPWFGQMLADDLKIDPKFYGVFAHMWQEENPDSFSGGRSAYGNVVLMDEASGIPQNICDVTQGFFMTPNPPALRLWLMSSQMRRPSGFFYDRFFDPVKSQGWFTRIMDTSDPVYGMDQAEILAAIREHGPESDFVRVEIRGLPPQQGDRMVFTLDEIRNAQSRDIEQIDKEEPLIMGCDPAPRGRSVIRFRRGRDARSIPPFVLEGWDNVRIVDFILQLIQKYNPDAICIDAGMGTGVIDVLRRNRVRVTEIWFGADAQDEHGEWAKRGAELVGKVRDWLPGGLIDSSPDLFNDMLKREWRWHGVEGNKKRLETKSDARKRGIASPDDLDALALTFAIDPPRRDRSVLRGGHAVIAENDYADSLFS